MAKNSKKRIPTNVITGFLGSGKTTAIAKLVEQRTDGEKWSIFVNEFGSVSIDQALVDSESQATEVQELGGGCACCTRSFAFQPLLAQFIRRSKPDRLILEPSGAGHPAGIVDILRGPNFAGALELRNTICLIDPRDFEDVRKRETDAFQDQLQLADIVLLNWTDNRDRGLIDRCREWVESLRPPKQLVLETSFGAMDPELLDMEFDTVDIHRASGSSSPQATRPARPILGLAPASGLQIFNSRAETESELDREPEPRKPLRFQNDDASYDACGWIFHVDDIFDRVQLFDLLESLRPMVRLKGVFRCKDNWWSLNRAKDETTRGKSAYRRDSRLEIILDSKGRNWPDFEIELLKCLSDQG